MPVRFEDALTHHSRPAIETMPHGAPKRRGHGRPLTIGLVNNMPDGALQATERQFVDLLAAATGERGVQIKLYTLPSVVRGEAAAAHLHACYSPMTELERDRPDALIVTGCEPRAASLADEPYWADLTRLVDWAERNTVSTLWSCLAAHAAVLYRDGIGRRRLPAKRLGVFDCGIRAEHPLLRGAPQHLRMSHSRWNDLDGDELIAKGYGVLTVGPGCGVNLFAKQTDSLFVFFQGHPEYDSHSIAREYRRDVARYLRFQSPDYPALPQNYFDKATTSALDAFRSLAIADRAAIGLRDLPRSLGLRAELTRDWGESALPVFRNWLDRVAEG